MINKDSVISTRYEIHKTGVLKKSTKQIVCLLMYHYVMFQTFSVAEYFPCCVCVWTELADLIFRIVWDMGRV